MKHEQAIYEAAEKLSAQLTGMPKSYQVKPGIYRVDFGNFIIETSASSENGEFHYEARQIWPALQVYGFIQVRQMMEKTVKETFQTA